MELVLELEMTELDEDEEGPMVEVVATKAPVALEKEEVLEDKGVSEEEAVADLLRILKNPEKLMLS